MKYLIPMLLLAAGVAVSGCKSSGWVWNKTGDPVMTAQVDEEPAPPPTEGQEARHVIYVLGVDGMD
jgi:hypothetical protein